MFPYLDKPRTFYYLSFKFYSVLILIDLNIDND